VTRFAGSPADELPIFRRRLRQQNAGYRPVRYLNNIVEQDPEQSNGE
jgi:transposase-like protein